MAKFTESPLFLLVKYFDEVSTVATSADSYYWTELYIKDRSTNELIKVRFRVEQPYLEDDRYFRMQKRIETLSPTASAYDPEPDFENGSEVYIRKDSFFHEWLTQHPLYNEYKKFLNLDKRFVYFGKIYSTVPVPYYHVKFVGMKHFTYNALPQSARTEKIKELFNIFFDKVYQKAYNLEKNIWSLVDPEEIDIDFLYYIANMYGLTDLDTIEESRRRQYVKNIIHFLKRKGTYSSLYVIFNTLLFNTTNYLNIYERYHLSSLPDGVPLLFFRDFLYTSYYSGTEVPTGGAGGFYYSAYSTLGYPDPQGPGWSFLYTYTDSWIVYHNLNEDWLITWAFNYDRERLIPAEIESTSDSITTYLFGTPRSGSTHILRPEYEHIQSTPSDTWVVDHNLDSQYIIAQCYDTNRKKIFPNNVYVNDNDTCTITMSESIAGYAGIVAPDILHTQSTPNSTWEIEHNTGGSVLTAFYSPSGNEIMPVSYTLSNENTLTTTWSTPISGYAAIKSTGASLYLLTMTPEPTGASGYLILSPHYKVEIDLSNQPEGDDYIMNEELIDTLIDNWEIDRPATKYVHYQELISPLTDFSGNGINLYNPSFTASLMSKFCQTPALSGSIMTKTLSGGYWKIGTGGSENWDAKVNDNLETPTLSGAFVNKANMSDYYYMDIEHQMDEKMDVTEIGIFDSDGIIVFYSYFDKIHVPKDVNFFVHYKVSKTII